MKTDSRYIWYVVDIVFFWAINIFIWAHYGGFIMTALINLNWFVVFLLAMGVYRLTDIITQESVTEIFRAPFMVKKPGTNEWEISSVGFPGAFGTLLSCNACMGVWISMIVLYSFIFAPTPTLAFMVIMTLTFFERFFSKIYNLLEKKAQ